MRDVAEENLRQRERPLAFEHGPLLYWMIERAARCLGLAIVELKMAQGLVEVDGKKRAAFRFSFSVIKQ